MFNFMSLGWLSLGVLGPVLFVVVASVAVLAVPAAGVHRVRSADRGAVLHLQLGAVRQVRAQGAVLVAVPAADQPRLHPGGLLLLDLDVLLPRQEAHLLPGRAGLLPG